MFPTGLDRVLKDEPCSQAAIALHPNQLTIWQALSQEYSLRCSLVEIFTRAPLFNQTAHLGWADSQSQLNLLAKICKH